MGIRELIHDREIWIALFAFVEFLVILFYVLKNKTNEQIISLIQYTIKDIRRTSDGFKRFWAVTTLFNARKTSHLERYIRRLKIDMVKILNSRDELNERYYEKKHEIDISRMINMKLESDKGKLINRNRDLLDHNMILSKQIDIFSVDSDAIRDFMSEYKIMKNRILGHASLYHLDPESVDVEKLIQIIVAQDTSMEKFSNRVTKYLIEEK